MIKTKEMAKKFKELKFPRVLFSDCVVFLLLKELS